MWTGFPLFPEQGSTAAYEIDALYGYLFIVSATFTLLIFFFVIYFAVKYRRRSEDELPPAHPVTSNLTLEVTWTIIPLCLTIVMFVWGARLYFVLAEPPANALEIQVVGKQWMWKIQHPEGQREINELHVPVGRPVKLRMISEDVIHSFYVPAFRVKADVLPGRYSRLWFEATKTGEHHLFCAEYCGTRHSQMVGRVVVMDPAEYGVWLTGGAVAETPARAGEKLFQRLGCATCHSPESGSRGPHLAGLFGREVRLADGRVVRADEAYIRESIVAPNAKVVAGYEPLMPLNYRDLVTEEGILQIIAYIKSIGAPEGDVK